METFPELPGLRFYPELFTGAECARAWEEIGRHIQDHRHFIAQSFGEYALLDANHNLSAVKLVQDRVRALNVLRHPTNHLQVNHYPARVGIDDHRDNIAIQEGAGINLQGSCIIHFWLSSRERIEILLQPGDVYIMAGQAADAVHGIEHGLQEFNGHTVDRETERVVLLLNHYDNEV